MMEVFFQLPSPSSGWPTASWTITPDWWLPSTTGRSPGAGSAAESRMTASLRRRSPISFGVVPGVR